MLKKYGFIRVGAYSCKVKVGDLEYNKNNIIECINSAYKEGIEIICFPELCLTSYTLGDMFLNDTIIDKSKEYLLNIASSTKNLDIVSIVGAPLFIDNQLFNCAFVIQKGKILGIVPKTYIPNYSEFYEKRWFSGAENSFSKEVKIGNHLIPFGNDLLFSNESDCVTFGIEICEDLWSLFPPSSLLAYKGADLIFNLSASNEIISKHEYRKQLVMGQSSKTITGYIYSGAGPHESSTDLVFGGHSMICENGVMLNEIMKFSFENELVYNDIDILKLKALRNKEKSYMDYNVDKNYRKIDFSLSKKTNKLVRNYEKMPFVDTNNENRLDICNKIINIQATGLCKRLLHLNCNNAVIGISGGLDSTLALLVTVEAFKKLKLDLKGIIGITMPGFGTSSKTLNNAIQLMNNLQITIKNIDIKEACTVHYENINHDINIHDITYENAQARERTQILMDIANEVNGIVIGTGDLSESALGWCTFNGDHMSMYNVNASIPKTLVKYLVITYGLNTTNNVKNILESIVNTPISPELLPPSKEQVIQSSEEKIGPYILHDFFLYHFLRYGAKFSKIYYLAIKTFKEFSKDEIYTWLKVFIKRFFNNQFKRNAVPDGPKVGTISLSPRGDLKLSSDTSYDTFLKELEENYNEE